MTASDASAEAMMMMMAWAIYRGKMLSNKLVCMALAQRASR